jgi:MFS family permease
VLGVVMFGGMAVIPLYMQIVKGSSPTRSGLLILPMVIGMGGASYAAGQLIARTGRYKVAPVTGSVILVAAVTMLIFVGADSSYFYVDTCLFLFGLGMGLNMSSMLVAMQNASDAQHMGVVTSAATFFRQMGGSIATAVFIAVLFARAHTEIPAQLAKSGVRLPAGRTIDLNDSRSISTLPHDVRHPVLVGFAHSTQTVFLISAVVSVFAVIFAALIREVPLRSVSGQQARQQAEAALAASEAAV